MGSGGKEGPRRGEGHKIRGHFLVVQPGAGSVCGILVRIPDVGLPIPAQGLAGQATGDGHRLGLSLAGDEKVFVADHRRIAGAEQPPGLHLLPALHGHGDNAPVCLLLNGADPDQLSVLSPPDFKEGLQICADVVAPVVPAPDSLEIGGLYLLHQGQFGIDFLPGQGGHPDREPAGRRAPGVPVMQGHCEGDQGVLLPRGRAEYPHPGGIGHLRHLKGPLRLCREFHRAVLSVHPEIPGCGQQNVLISGVHTVSVRYQGLPCGCIPQPPGGKSGVQPLQQCPASGLRLGFLQRGDGDGIGSGQGDGFLVAVPGPLELKDGGEGDLLRLLSLPHHAGAGIQGSGSLPDGNHVRVGGLPGNEGPGLLVHRPGKGQILGDGTPVQGHPVQDLRVHGLLDPIPVPGDQNRHSGQRHLLARLCQEEIHLIGAAPGPPHPVGVGKEIGDGSVFPDPGGSVFRAVHGPDSLDIDGNPVVALPGQILPDHVVHRDVLPEGGVQFVPVPQGLPGIQQFLHGGIRRLRLPDGIQCEDIVSAVRVRGQFGFIRIYGGGI